MFPLFAFCFLCIAGFVTGAWVLRPIVMKKLEQRPSPKLLGPAQEEVDDLKDRLRRLEEVVLFDGDKAELEALIRAAEERGRAAVPSAAQIEARLRAREQMNHIQLREDNRLPWP